MEKPEKLYPIKEDRQEAKCFQKGMIWTFGTSFLKRQKWWVEEKIKGESIENGKGSVTGNKIGYIYLDI